jgi:hypothetical protein
VDVKFVSDMRATQTEGVREQGADENRWTGVGLTALWTTEITRMIVISAIHYTYVIRMTKLRRMRLTGYVGRRGRRGRYVVYTVIHIYIALTTRQPL